MRNYAFYANSWKKGQFLKTSRNIIFKAFEVTKIILNSNSYFSPSISSYDKKSFQFFLLMLELWLIQGLLQGGRSLLLASSWRSSGGLQFKSEQLRKMQNGFLHFYMLNLLNQKNESSAMVAWKLTFPLHFPHFVKERNSEVSSSLHYDHI